jgi:tetratricopeptide (TPR) repeat protein
MALETIHALEQGTAMSASTTLALSDRVRQIVTGRVERISEPGQQLLAAAAVIGRDFEFRLLERAARLGELAAAAGVEELVRRRLVRVNEERFAFTHDWIREVIYDQLLPPRRRLLHRHVADGMESLYADQLEPHFAALGRHWYEAGGWEKAARYLHRAGRSAMERSASHEAAASLQQALDALRRVPETQEMLAEGVDIRLELWNALLLAQHIDRLSDLLEETQLLADRLGDVARRAHVSVLRSHSLWWTGNPREALRLARDALAIGERIGDRSLVTVATTFVWSVLQTSGDYRGVEEVVEAFKRQHDDADPGRSGHGLHMIPYVSCRCHLAVALGRRGQFDRAYANVEEARIVAEQADHRHSLIGAYWALGEVHITRGAVGEAVDALERALGLCREWEVPLVRPACLSALGYTYVLYGRVEEGMSQLREAVASMEIMGWAFSHSLAHIRLAEACLLSGRFPEALEVAQRALTLARERHERGFEARALRLHADIAVTRKPLDVAVTEDLYRQTRALAAELDMQPLIGHVELGLALLYRRCARYEEARAHLTAASTVYAERGMPLFRERAEAEARALAAADRGSVR